MIGRRYHTRRSQRSPKMERALKELIADWIQGDRNAQLMIDKIHYCKMHHDPEAKQICDALDEYFQHGNYRFVTGACCTSCRQNEPCEGG